jgi:hypothetical protein
LSEALNQGIRQAALPPCYQMTFKTDIIVLPISFVPWWLMKEWLVMGGLSVMLIIIRMINYHSVKAAMTNPAKSLKAGR